MGLAASLIIVAAGLCWPSLANGFVLAELSSDPSVPPEGAETRLPDVTQEVPPCAAGVTFIRNLRYGGDDQNVLDVATAQTRPDSKRPIVVFFAGTSFSNEPNSTSLDAVIEKSMCFAAGNGLVVVHASYRRSPAAVWPAGAVDAASAISWVFENADLFGGNAQEIVAIGYGSGAFHLATLLSHSELQEKDDVIAGVVLLSGVYEPTKDADESERTYTGSDVNVYRTMSAVQGLTEIEEPLVLAWSSSDAPRVVAQSERLQAVLCSVGHCPRTAVLSHPSSLASVFDLDGTSADLHERLRQLIGQLDARGLP
jgi:hypothetical protein